MPDTLTRTADLLTVSRKSLHERDQQIADECCGTIPLPNGQTARVTEQTYFPNGVLGNRPQILLTVEEIPEQI